MTIGAMAKLAGVGVQTVRFYERKGLLTSPPRTAGGYRAYRDRDLRRLNFIRGAQAMGFTLREIAGILGVSDRGASPCSDVIRIAERRLQVVEAEIAKLSALRTGLRTALGRWRSEPRPNCRGDLCQLIVQARAQAALGDRRHRRTPVMSAPTKIGRT